MWIVVCLFLLGLVFAEIGRTVSERRREVWPEAYLRERLGRRIIVGVLLLVECAMLQFFPMHVLTILTLFTLVMVLVWRDLRETRRMIRATEKELRDALFSEHAATHEKDP